MPVLIETDHINVPRFSDPHWSGPVIEAGSGPKYDSAVGSWAVPVTTGSPFADAFSSTWIGIDGAGAFTGDLLQAGTEQDVPLNGSPNYFAWLQYIPFDATAIKMLNLPVNQN